MSVCQLMNSDINDKEITFLLLSGSGHSFYFWTLN